MGKKRILVIFLISFSYILSMDVYIPKTRREREYLEKIRERKLVVAEVEKSYFATEKIEGVSFDDIIEEMLRDYLQLDIVVEKGDWNQNYKKFKKGEIDILNYLTPSKERSAHAVFTRGIIDEKLVVVSKDKKLDVFNDLNGLDVYVIKESIYEKFLEKFIEKNEMHLNYLRVANLESEKKLFYADSDLNTIGEKNKLVIGNLPKPSIGLLKEHEPLVKIINNALEERYEAKTKEWMEKRKEKIFKEKLDQILTEDEKSYLKSLPPLKIAYGNIERISSYSNLQNKYIGIAPRIINYLSNKMDIKVKERIDFRKTNWRNWNDKLLSKEIDMILLSKTREREKDYIFTNKLANLNVYEINNLNWNEKKPRKIGVTKNSIEEKVAREYFFNSEIVLYDTEDKINLDFKRKKLTTILSINSEIFDISKYEVKVLDVVPMNIALNKENIVLRDILNKAINEFIDLDEFMDESDILIKKDKIYEKKAHKNMISLIAISCLLLIILVAHQTLKVFKHKKTNKELLRDELTGLYSRRVYNQFCKENRNLKGTAILLDLNNFKVLNDNYGHDYGDRILIEVALSLKKVFDREDIFRISGDEFYVFSKSTENIESNIERLKRVFKDSILLRTYNISFSLGYYYKEKNIPMVDAFKYADMAMYFAKREKKEWYEEATEEFIDRNRRKKRVEILLRKGFEKEFYGVFQGKYDLNTGKMIGAEALTRWVNGELGMVPPNEFIPIAEELGLVYKIDYKIAECAIKETKKLLTKKEVDHDFRMSFNISSETFRKKDFVDYILKLLNKYSLNGKNIEIEITEGMFLKDAKDIVAKLEKLSENGIYISIDGFTAGYSMLGLLTTLPINVVKFDRSLISTISEEVEAGKSVYSGLTKMITSLKLKVVAEGIEDKKQLQFLKEIGINYGQGYYLGKPERVLKENI